MRFLWTIIIIAAILTIGMFWFWASVMKSGTDILEYDYPSRDIGHSLKKKILIDSLYIVNPDTIRTNGFEQIDILPIASWIEKMTYWKSGSLTLDSLGSYSDTVMLIVNFKDFINGQRRISNNNGYGIIEFENPLGGKELVYMDDNIVQLTFKMVFEKISDTTKLKTQDGQEIVLMKII